MSPPIRDGSGNDIGAIRLGDGSEISEVRTGAGDVLFTATTIPDSGVKHYYDVRELNASDGDSISQLDDQKGSENLTQSTSADQPTYKANQINGNPSLLFQSDYLNVDFSTTISQPFEIFMVGRFNDVSGENYRGYDAFNNRVRLLTNDLSDESQWNMFAGSSLRGGTLDTNVHYWTSVFNGSNSINRLDGSDLANGDAGSNNLDGLTLANRSSGTDATDVDIGWWGVYDPTANGYSRSNVESYLSREFGPF